jgi:hypothetical protein
MSVRTLLQSAQQYPRHCFADISVDHHEFGRWHYRNELRGKNASPLLPVVDADVVPEGFGPRIRDEESRAASKFLREILLHSHFPALVVVAKNAKHNATTMGGAHASEDAPQAREKSANRIDAGVPERNSSCSSFATGARA